MVERGRKVGRGDIIRERKESKSYFNSGMILLLQLLLSKVN